MNDNIIIAPSLQPLVLKGVNLLLEDAGIIDILKVPARALLSELQAADGSTLIVRANDVKGESLASAIEELLDLDDNHPAAPSEGQRAELERILDQF